jgi:hypothetical protein
MKRRPPPRNEFLSAWRASVRFAAARVAYRPRRAGGCREGGRTAQHSTQSHRGLAPSVCIKSNTLADGGTAPLRSRSQTQTARTADEECPECWVDIPTFPAWSAACRGTKVPTSGPSMTQVGVFVPTEPRPLASPSPAAAPIRHRNYFSSRSQLIDNIKLKKSCYCHAQKLLLTPEYIKF